jgi:Mlc titration factor MtfA (ptsG expression regulator)
VLWLILLAMVVICAGILGRWYLREVRRKRLMVAPFPSGWEEIIRRNVPLYARLPASLKQQLHGRIQVLLAEKHFEGCGGLEMTDEIKVTIAAQAGILLLNRKSRYYPGLASILVYPSTFLSDTVRHVGDHVYIEEQSAHLGESWRRGALVLAWDSVKRGGMDISDGHNVVLHEFAHQLDQEDGAADGAPILERGSLYAAWARILHKEYERLQSTVGSGLKTVMDEYGATNPAEFFAVATETFFEKPHAMQRRHPELYEALKGYYKLDPVAWEDDADKKR